jgi:hypothetical protein
MHRSPVMHHWVVLAARWWTKLASMDPSVPRMARSAWLADIALMRGGATGSLHSECWAYKLLSTMQAIGVLPSGDWQWSTDLARLTFDEVVQQRLSALLNAAWGVAPAVEPRVAPSAGLDMCTHCQWVYGFDARADYTDRRTAPAYLRLCLPTAQLRALAQLRLGWARLEVRLGRQRRPRVDRHRRLCPLCSAAGSPGPMRQTMQARAATCGAGATGVEDMRHFLLECPAYDGVRQQYGLLPAQPWLVQDPAACMRALFAHESQVRLARMIHAMCTTRTQLLAA